VTDRSITDVVADLLADLPTPARRELHVAEDVWRFLRDRYIPVVRPETAAALLDAQVVVDDDLIGGQWQLREDGVVVSSGDMAPAPEGKRVFYSPTGGWMAVRADLMEFPLVASWRTV